MGFKNNRNLWIKRVLMAQKNIWVLLFIYLKVSFTHKIKGRCCLSQAKSKKQEARLRYLLVSYIYIYIYIIYLIYIIYIIYNIYIYIYCCEKFQKWKRKEKIWFLAFEKNAFINLESIKPIKTTSKRVSIHMLKFKS